MSDAIVISVFMLCLAVISGSCLAGESAAAGADKDILAIRKRILGELCPTDPKSPQAVKLLESVKKYAPTLRANGSWADIDYTNKSKDKWEACWHTKRLLDMAQVYRSPKLPGSGNPKTVEKIVKGLAFWLKEDTRARGWYHQQLFVPHNLGKISLLLGDALPRDQHKAAVRRLRERSSFSGKQNLRTGSNLLSFARNNVLLGCIDNSPKDITEAFKRAAGELKITSGNGIQEDRSYLFHGSCLHVYTYGATLSINFARLAWLGRGTRFGLPKHKLKLLFEFILDGQQWFTRGPEADYLCTGRAFCRPHSVHVPGPARQWRPMAEIAGERHQERKDFLARREMTQPPGKTGPVGNRFFWRSAVMIHRRPEYYVSVRMLARDLASTDKVNYENLFGHHLSDGAMCLMRTGNEYAGIYPLWNWRGIPGTTVEDGNPPLDWHKLRTYGVRHFVGGASDGQYGVAAMDFARGPQTGERMHQRSRRINAKTVTLTARKAWFFFDREIVCLGAGITGKNGKQVVTTLNQCRLSGKVSASAGVKLTDKGATFETPAWIHHDGFGYLFPGKAAVRLETAKKTGSWEDINKSRPGEKITDSVFNLFIDHGKKPKDASYVYYLVPGIKSSEMKAYAGKNDVEVLSNTPDLQAVRHKKLKITAVAFYKAGKIEPPGGSEIEVSSPCMLVVREIAGGKLRVAFSKPDVRGNSPAPVKIRIGERRTQFTPPQGVRKGRSVVRNL